MGSSRAIWRYERELADRVARGLIDASRVRFGWRMLFLPNFLVHYFYFRKNLSITRRNLLFTKRLAFQAAKEIFGGESQASEMRLIEIKTRKLLDREKKGYYTEKIRRKQLSEMQLLVDHYLGLLNSNANGYTEMVKATYQSKQDYLSFLNKLQTAEKDVIQAALSSMKKGTKQERLNWFRRVEEGYKQARMEEAENLFPGVP